MKRQGFFAESTLASTAPMPRVARCGECGLLNHCKSPKMPVSGKGKRGILIVGEGPGKTEDELGRSFVGESGRYLEATLRRLGVDMRHDCWVTNAIICRPENNRTPTDHEIRYCRPNLTKTLEQLQPQVIIPLGAPAVKSVLMGLWKDKIDKITRWVGWNIPCCKLNAWICPNYHPAYITRLQKTNLEGVSAKYFEHYLERAVERDSRPFDTLPDYNSQVEIVYDSERAAGLIRKVISKGGTAAFDYETDRLKPDAPDAEIVSASICWQGRKTFAFPWDKTSASAMREFVRSPILKIAANKKFEERWTIAKLGTRVRKWDFDTMLAAHALDNREGITGLKFQVFVQFGVEDYNSHMDKYLKSEGEGGSTKNRIREIDLQQLLLYNGLDSLFEYKLAMIQKGQFDG